MNDTFSRLKMSLLAVHGLVWGYISAHGMDNLHINLLI